VSVTTARGFTAAGGHAGIKADAGALDMALVATDDGRAVAAAGVFTTNKATAAPVLVSQAHLAATAGRAAAVILNSGNANAATGAAGRAIAEAACGLVAKQLACAPEEVLVCSTGLIGIPLALDPFEAAVPGLASSRSRDGAAAAARAILTTDTTAKEVVVEGRGFVVGGMAKGAAMLAPNMATMLAVLTTDAAVDPGPLRAALASAVDRSFNLLSVDGAQSTNDTVLVLASGRGDRVEGDALETALLLACTSLAEQMAADAEGHTKVVRIQVKGAVSDADARAAARQVAESQLVKCSFHGGDPYWGRIVSELGTAGVDFDPGRVSVAYGGTEVCRDGVAVAHDAATVASHMRGATIEIVCDLGLGTGGASLLTNDLGPGYIDENKSTS
jgi:glutamate N-acetyltransferase/amino-acid N-acetyltransferase